MRAQGERGGVRGRVGLELESGSVGGRKTVPTGGARLAVRQGGEGRAGPDWARRRGTGRPAMEMLGREKKEKGERGPAGLKG